MGSNNIGIEDMWQDDIGEIYIRDEEGHVSQVNAGWDKGCYHCEAFQGEIDDITKEQGVLEGCKHALENLNFSSAMYLCDDCLKEWDRS